MDERKRALVVGINAYGGGIPRLGSAVRDAEAVANKLELAHGYDVKLLRDAEATAKAITTSLAEVVAAGLSENTSFVLYYAGHGVADDGCGGAGRPQGFLLPYDAHLTNKETWLGMQALQAALDGLACRHLMLVLDCCYAGAIQWVSTRSVGNVRRPLYKSQYERYLANKAWQVLTSASSDETADDAAPVTADRGGTETPEGHSPFAQALIEGLSGHAADSSRGGMAADGVLTATELHQFIYEKVVVNDRQTPGIFPLKPDNKGEFVFLAPGVELNLEPDPPLDDANNPWLGLDAYAKRDVDVFFGRVEATKKLLGRVEAHRFVAVVGPSGSGKSSLIRAGLLPVLEGPTWAVAESARLTADPITPLTEATMQLAAAPASERRLLVIDQFEDLFRRADDAARARFLDDVRHLIEAEDGPTVVIALRSDFEPRAAEELGDLWTKEARYPVPDFFPDDLRDVILGPAQANAVFFEPAELVEDLVHEVVRMPGAAPLLSLTLASLYRQAQERRRENDTADRMISIEDYKAVGGVIGVLHHHANKLYDEADKAHRETIRRILLRLVDQEPDGLTGRNVDRDELRFGPEHDELVTTTLENFTAARLLIVGNKDGRDYVEPAHDGLVSTWDKQLLWLAQSGSQEVVRDASKYARAWSREDGRSKRSEHLWDQNPNLAELERRDQNHELNALEQDFRSVSSTRRRQKARIRRTAIGALVVLTVVAIGAGVYARVKQTEAVREAERASSRALASDALNNVETETDLAALLALESVRITNTAEARGSLAGVLSLPTRFLQRSPEHGDEVVAIAFSTSGRTAATGDASGVVMLWDVNEEPFPSPQATPIGAVELDVPIRELFVSDDAEYPVLAFDTGGFAYLVDFTTNGVEVLEPPDEFVDATVNEGITVFAGITADGVLHVYDIDDQFEFAPRSTTSIDPPDVTDLTVSPDGKSLAWGVGSELYVWSSLDGAAPLHVDLGDGLNLATIAAVAFGPDDDPDRAVVGVGMDDGTVIVADRNDTTLNDRAFPGPVNRLFDLAFKPGSDGETFTLASTHSNGDVNLFDVVSGDGSEPIGFFAETMLGHNDEATKVAFAPDGRIASGDFSGEILWWLDVPIPSLGVPWQPSVDPAAPATTSGDPPPPMFDAAFAYSNQIVSMSSDALLLSDRDSFETLDEIAQDSDVISVDAAGDVIAVGLEGSTLILGKDGNTLRPLESDQGLVVRFVALSSDGRQLATVSGRSEASYSGLVDIWDVEAGTLSYSVELPDEFEPSSALFTDDGVVWIGGWSPDGYPASLDGYPTVLKIAATSGAVVGELQHSSRKGNAVTALAISDDGRTLATGATDRLIALWDTGTLEARGREFTGHRGNVTGIVFWDGGDTLISSDDAGDIVLWDVSDRRQFARLGGPTNDVLSLDLDADSATLLASSEDGSLWTWSLDDWLWRDLACQLAGRNMTQAEWEVYGDGGTRIRHCEFDAEDGDVPIIAAGRLPRTIIESWLVRDADYSGSPTD